MPLQTVSPSEPPGITHEVIEPMRSAIELENIRRHLSSWLLNNPYAARVVSGQLAKRMQHANDGVDEFGGGLTCPQDRLPVVSIETTAGCNQGGARMLPLFLIDVAGLLDTHPTCKSFTIRHKRKLADLRRDLQAARQGMIAKNTGLVAFAAQKYSASHLGFDDLMQEGSLGLIKAVDRFDPGRGIRFSTYAMYWIKQAISRLIVKQENIVRLPLPLAEKAALVFEAMRLCYLECERWPSCEELKTLCDLPDHDIKTICAYYQATHSLDAAVDRDVDGQQLMERMAQHHFDLPLDALIDENLSDFLAEAIATLPDTQGGVLKMRFGLQNQAEMTLQAIADQLHVTRERVRQIQNEALKKLKQQFGYDLLPFLDANDGL